MATAAVPKARTSVLRTRAQEDGSSARTVFQCSIVHGSGRLKKPKSFMKVPSSAKANGSAE